MIQEIIFLNQKKVIVRQWEWVMLLIVNTFSTKITVIKIKKSIKDYFDEIKSYLSDIINDYKTQD